MYFAQYMDEHLIHGGDMLTASARGGVVGGGGVGGGGVGSGVGAAVTPPAIFMKKWFRTTRAIVMYLNSGTLQVSERRDDVRVAMDA